MYCRLARSLFLQAACKHAAYASTQTVLYALQLVILSALKTHAKHFLSFFLKSA